MKVIFTLITFLFLPVIVISQITRPTPKSDPVTEVQNELKGITKSSSKSILKPDTKESRPEDKEKIKETSKDSERWFKEGLLSLMDGRKKDALNNLNKSIEVILSSQIRLDSEEASQLKDCYTQLQETIYRIEFPSENEIPQIRALSTLCSWNIDGKTADDIAKRLLTSLNDQNTRNDLTSASAIKGTAAKVLHPGFNEQKFESSPLDELAKLELSENEKQDIIYQENKPKVVKAQAGDTVAKIAQRNGLNAAEVAKYNGLLPSTVLGAGREIKIPKIFPKNNIIYSKLKVPTLCRMPLIQDIRPGMTLIQAQKILKKTLKESYYSGFSPATKGFEIKNYGNTRLLTFNVINNQIMSILAFYNDEISWNGLTEFTETAVKNMNLPISLIIYSYPFNQVKDSNPKMAQLKCGNLMLISQLSSSGYSLSLTDMKLFAKASKAYILINQKQLENKKKEKINFKP